MCVHGSSATGRPARPDAVAHVWPQTIAQTRIVHLPRNRFRYAARQDWDKIAKALKPVHTAPTGSAATERWLAPFLQFDPEIRRA
jgi:putative transposase